LTRIERLEQMARQNDLSEGGITSFCIVARAIVHHRECNAAAAVSCHHPLIRFNHLANQLASYLTLSSCTHHIDVQ